MSDKRQAFAAGAPADFVNHLFFQARNLAVEAVLLRLENLFLAEGLTVKCRWLETSLPGASIELRLSNPKPGGWEYATGVLRLARERIAAPAEVSDFHYALAEVQADEHWPGRQPQVVQAFRGRIRELEAGGYLAAEVAKVNYPFDYATYSSF